jgi:hypothetical protein
VEAEAAAPGLEGMYQFFRGGGWQTGRSRWRTSGTWRDLGPLACVGDEGRRTVWLSVGRPRDVNAPWGGGIHFACSFSFDGFCTENVLGAHMHILNLDRAVLI